MKRHYIVYALTKYDAVCRYGAVCADEELHALLRRKNIKAYKRISVDGEEAPGWREAEWITV